MGDIKTGDINNSQTSSATGGQLSQTATASFDFNKPAGGPGGDSGTPGGDAGTPGGDSGSPGGDSVSGSTGGS